MRRSARRLPILALAWASFTAWACGVARDDGAPASADSGTGGIADATIDLALPTVPLACAPLDPPPARSYAPPAPLYQGRCDPYDAYSLLRCFVADPQGRDCVGTRDARRATPCGQCIFTEVDASAYGPIIVDGKSARLNVGGCVQRLTGDLDAGCAGELTAFDECAMASCQHCYDEGASQVVAEACLAAARSGPCARLGSGPLCQRAALGDAAAECQLAGDFAARATALVNLFCGSVPDAGTPIADSAVDGD